MVGIEAHGISIVGCVELTQAQIRILGVLLEKERTTPDDYPQTANSIMRGANQTTSRDPIVDYPISLVEHELASLKDLGLVRFVHSQSNRATKYRHVLNEAWHLDEREASVLGLLFLRGDQTPGELRTRSERTASFGSVDEVVSVLGALAARPEPLVEQRPRLAGQKDARWGHRWLPFDPDRAQAPESPRGAVATAERVSGLERTVGELRAEVALLRYEMDALRAELGVKDLGVTDLGVTPSG